MYFFPFWQGYVTINGDASICGLKPLLGKGSQTNSLPTGLNRISWKRYRHWDVPAIFFWPTDRVIPNPG